MSDILFKTDDYVFSYRAAGICIQERLKDLRVERGLTLEQLAEETHLSKSA